MRVESFKTFEDAMERIRDLAPELNARPEKEYDSEDPNADAEGNAWVIGVFSSPDAEKLYLCTDGSIR